MSCSGSSTLSTYAVMSVTSTAYSSPHSCVGVPGGGGAVVYPWSPRDVGQVVLEKDPSQNSPQRSDKSTRTGENRRRFHDN